MSLNTRSILIAEDEVLIALTLTRALAAAGAQVTTVGYVEDGLALELGGFDAALLDVSLTDGEVFPLARALKNAGVPMVFHSGHICHGTRFEAFPQAVLLEKPAHRDEIISALAQVLDPEAMRGAA